jgi:UDP-glucuronate 4-epimerase
MRILLTGAAGFIGSHTAEALVGRGDEVVGVDNFNAFYAPAIKRRNAAAVAARGGAKFTLAEGDITDERFLDGVFTTGAFDAVVHLAAWAGVRPSIDNPGIYMDVNVRGTVNLLERMRSKKIDKLVFASSSSVYGGRETVPFRETDPVDRPISPYAASKKAGEVLAYTWHHLHGLNVAALRYFTVYGPRQRPEMAIHKFATMLARKQPIPMFGNGDTARDYTFIDDIVQGTVAALDHCAGYEIYNLGEEHTTTLRELIDLLAAAMKTEATIREESTQPGDVPITYADVSKARAKIGYRPSTTMREGIERFVKWFDKEGVR